MRTVCRDSDVGQRGGENVQIVRAPGLGLGSSRAQLAWYGLPFELEEVEDLFQSAAARVKLQPANPLAQVPILILPNGQVMTESAAITLRLADVTGSHELVPAPGEPMRPAFLRWLVFLVANVYPTFTYADDPARFVPIDEARQGFGANVSAYRERLWRQLEETAGDPWFFGERFSALDAYVAVMTHWRPRRAWFERACPRLCAIARRADAEPSLAAVWRRNWPEDQ